MIKIKILFLIFLVLPAALFAWQSGDDLNIAKLHFLDFTNELPEDLLSTKTAVLVAYPSIAKRNPERGDWKSFAERSHAWFKRMGVDAVGYYFQRDFMSGQDAAIFFAKEMKGRGVNNIIFLSRESNVASGEYNIIVTPFNGEASVISDGQKAYKVEGADLSSVLKIFGNKAYRSKQAKTNFLIPDFPEFFEKADIINGRRIPSYARDLKVRKLAILKFDSIKTNDENLNASQSGNAANIRTYNSEVARNNKKLESVMQSYPLEYTITEPTSNDALYKKGFQYVLLRLNTTGSNVRQLLGYEIDPTVSDYITVRNRNGSSSMQSISINSPVHKYYVKHLYTGDVYTGADWDADLTWEEALKNFIQNMKDDLKLK
ncbi:MAG: hypothetical protein JXQ96_16015 [Cyclobacteriaceae bacterium]